MMSALAGGGRMTSDTATLEALVDRYIAAQTLQQLVACSRAYEAAGAPRPAGAPSIRLASTGNYSTQFLTGSLALALAARNVAAEVYESPYNQWRAELLDGASPLYVFAPTHILLVLTSIELAFGPLRNPKTVVETVAAAVQTALKATDAHLLITMPEPLADETSDGSAAYAWRHAVNDGLRAVLSGPRVTLIDIEPLIRSWGSAAWFDDRFYDTAKLPFHPDRTPAMLRVLADSIVGVVAPRCKLVVVDLDDTLWGGRVGDDGYDGIDLDPAGKGRHFLRLQTFLKGLHGKGIVLAIASKNEPANVREVFEKRPEMVMRFEDFADVEIHWEPKSESLARILERLKLSTAGVVFLDDNPVERAEVRRRFPDIAVPELADDPAQWVPMLERSGLFEHRVATDESRERNRMYAENAARDAAQHQAGDYREFLRGLEMVMEGSPLDVARERVIELINKTNQFNLTTRRYNWNELAAVLRGGFGRCYRLTDKFGDNGIISVVAVTRDDESDARIDVWLMSCRVLGRKVEEAILADVADKARALGARRLIGEYRPTAKNALVRELYPRLGFTESGRNGDGVLYALPLENFEKRDGAALIELTERRVPTPAAIR
jgi:FkbH-like protein